MIFIYCICGFGAVIGWLVAEVSGKLGLRLFAGMFALIVVGLLSFQGGWAKPTLENEDMHACLAEIQTAMSKGDYARIQAGYREYAADMAEGDGELASRHEMLMELRAFKR